MNPGRLDRRITLQQLTPTRDEIGSVIEAWENQYVLWAEIPKQNGNESLIADADRASESRQFRIRYRAGISPNAHRVSYQDKTYDIRHIGEEGRQNYLLITATWNQSIT
jgi:SPP1 family predicted phage head-tail adaptor